MEKNQKLTIGITDCGKKFPNYENWIKATGNTEVIRLSHHLNNLDDTERCDGFIMSGGHDVHPKFYNKKEYLEILDKEDINEQRDEFELRVIEAARKNNKPILGVCRGLQITNVFFGGTLIPDIPSVMKSDEHDKDQNREDSVHEINVNEDSLLEHIVRQKTGMVNSAHHQCADQPGEGLQANCFSEGGIIEGLEEKAGKNKAGVLLVQWHPERMKDQHSPFSINIRDWIIREAAKWK